MCEGNESSGARFHERLDVLERTVWDEVKWRFQLSGLWNCRPTPGLQIESYK